MSPRAPTPTERSVIDDALLAARVAYPYYARALAALTPLVADGSGTAAVTARWHMLVDVEWLASLPTPTRAWVIGGHEVEHLLRGHAERRGERQPREWNLACDREINDDGDRTHHPPGICYPEQIGAAEGLLAEEYYCDDDAGASCGGGSGAGAPLPDEPAGGGVGPGDVDVLRDAVAADVIAHEKRHPGAVPEHVVMWASTRAVPPRVDWRRLLAAAVTRTLTSTRGRDDYSWARAPRRRSAVLRPGLVRAQREVTLVVDTSGSMAGHGATVIGIASSLRRLCDRLRTIQCDAAVSSRVDGVPRQWVGGGGTDLAPALAEARGCVVVVTDGELGWPADAPPCVVLVVGDAPLPTPDAIRVTP